MIVSASRRTDIPAWYADWLYGRIREGFVIARNPRNPRQLRRVPLDRESVDGIVFWTKNPQPMLGRLRELDGYAYYFQCTVNAYGIDIERNLPDKERVVLPAVLDLAERLGPRRVIWRYDPILLTERYSLSWHEDAFGRIAERLRGATEHVTVSFIDMYRGTLRRCPCRALSEEEQLDLARRIERIAAENGMSADACAEKADLSDIGVGHARCVNAELLADIGNREISVKRDKNQRQECGCAESVDIGAYNTCRNGCTYCYANYNTALIDRNRTQHDSRSPCQIGWPPAEGE